MFESVARAWHDERKAGWKPRYAQEIISSLERDIFPTLGYMDVRQIRAKHVREVLKRVQDRGALETGHRLLQRIFSVYEWAIAEELAEVDPTTGVTPALKKVIKRRQPAVLSIPRARAFLMAYEATPGHPGTKLASRLLALTAAGRAWSSWPRRSNFTIWMGQRRLGRCQRRK
jgi:site-specific recombinase XerD